MTRDQALKAFFAAVDAYMPHDALEGRTAIRNAGIDYADAAATEVPARWQASATAAAPSDDRHLLDGVEPSPAPQTEGLRLISDNTQGALTMTAPRPLCCQYGSCLETVGAEGVAIKLRTPDSYDESRAHYCCAFHAALSLMRLAVDRNELANPNALIDPRNYPNDWKVK